MLAGEASGDLLGASVMQSLKRLFPSASFEGIGGAHMLAEGFHSFYPLDRFSVMGFIEPIKRLPSLLRMRRFLLQRFLETPPDVFIGIDYPDFNLSIETILKKKQIKTVHLVSPSVWAWRKSRIKTIKKAVDLMLTLFPFETKIYEQHQVPVQCIGHPLADTIPMYSDKQAARQLLGLDRQGKVVALLPGSREQELKYLTQPFIETAKLLQKKEKNITFITAIAHPARQLQWDQYCQQSNFSEVRFFHGNTQAVMAASDAILLASGTASLEALLVKRPTVIAYKLSPLVYTILKKCVNIPFIGLPNLLANRILMPEFIQSDVVPLKMATCLATFLNEEQKIDLDFFKKIHLSLKKEAGRQAAHAIARLCT